MAKKAAQKQAAPDGTVCFVKTGEERIGRDHTAIFGHETSDPKYRVAMVEQGTLDELSRCRNNIADAADGIKAIDNLFFHWDWLFRQTGGKYEQFEHCVGRYGFEAARRMLLELIDESADRLHDLIPMIPEPEDTSNEDD